MPWTKHKQKTSYIDGCFSFCFVTLFLIRFRILKEQKNISVEDKLLPVFQHGFLTSAYHLPTTTMVIIYTTV